MGTAVRGCVMNGEAMITGAIVMLASNNKSDEYAGMLLLMGALIIAAGAWT